MSRISKLADLVANIPIKPLLWASLCVRTEGAGGRNALELLANSSDGCTEAMLLAQGFNPDTLATLVRAGFATEHTERVRAGGERIEVRSLRISDAGRRVIGRR